MVTLITGIGVDTVDIARFATKISEHPRVRERLFTLGEQQLPVPSLAARFAAKEALVKALGGSTRGATHLKWHDIEVLRTGEQPRFSHTEGLAAMLAACGVSRLHLSLTHDGGFATAFVVAECEAAADPASSASPELPAQLPGEPLDEEGTGTR